MAIEKILNFVVEILKSSNFKVILECTKPMFHEE
jgi:hypothetical protein